MSPSIVPVFVEGPADRLRRHTGAHLDIGAWSPAPVQQIVEAIDAIRRGLSSRASRSTPRRENE